MSEKASADGSAGELVLYATEDGQSRLFLRAEGGTVWLNQAELAALFQTTKQNISLHVRNVLSEGELAAAATVKDHLTVRTEGKRGVRRKVQLYNLDMILAVGYRVKSPRGTQFRQWATTHLREYLVKGFVLDDERLKNPPVGDKAARDHFDELLDRIRDIRASERRMYLRVREIFAMAADYVPSLPETTRFFKVIQNKLHYAVHGQTASELILRRADASQPHMGLSTWKGAQVTKADVGTAKNYLRDAEIGELNRIVTMWLDFAEDQALRRKEIFLKDWAERLDAFLNFNERQVLTGAGTVSHKDAVAHAEGQYERFAAQRRATLEAEGEAYAARVLAAPAADEAVVEELGQVAKRLTKKKGKGDAA